MKSINQNVHRDALPDFRNLGVILRIVLIVLALSAFVALCQSDAWRGAVPRFLELSAPVQPALLLSILMLAALSPTLRRLDYRMGILAVLLIEVIIATAVHRTGGQFFFGGDSHGQLERFWLFTLATTGFILYYFHLRNRALSPALTEARLQALQARIRPHFLFNSINAVLSLIRDDPKRAETALEDMADLFRVLMADNRDLSTLVRRSRAVPPVSRPRAAAPGRAPEGRMAHREHAGRCAGAAAGAAAAGGERGLSRHRAAPRSPV